MLDFMMNLLPIDGEVYLDENFLNLDISRRFLDQLLNETAWKQEQIRMFGRWVEMPRLTAWYGEEGKRYIYSGLENEPLPFGGALQQLRTLVEKATGQRFNSVLLNLYRNGQDSMGWHQDNEPELGTNPSIASVSLGATRRFKFRHAHDPNHKVDVELKSGSLLWMKGVTQKCWYHALPKSMKVLEPRINLTFRNII